MHTISNEASAGRGRRRTHSAEFKAQVVAACSSPGVSIAAVSMAHGVNANLARRWVLQAERRGGAALARAANSAVLAAFVPVQLPVQLPPAEAEPAAIRIELRQGTTAITVSWPCAAASQCAAWMRELLR
ncbi:transposase [Variovorax sp. LjRoot84]|uniref:IS66-like element accessory protein TnpA n=1 Tax=Variovorax sp. LjRoot84 TaxID=3342340 RepID=UPI003ECE34D3